MLRLGLPSVLEVDQPASPSLTMSWRWWKRLLKHRCRIRLRYYPMNSLNRVMAVAAIIVFFLATPTIILGQSAAGEGTGSGAEWRDFWMFRLLLNVLGYAIIVIPGYVIIRYVKKSNFLDTAGVGCVPSLIRTCVVGHEPDKVSVEEGPATPASAKPEESFYQRTVRLVGCACMLMGTYVLWGLLQERIMAFEYGAVEGTEQKGERFKNSQFLVFMNRILAFFFAMLVLFVKRQPKHTAPLYKYSYSSFSNIMSSWCQYEALKFVSFPVQVLAKASKVIPVMLMGKVVSKRTYDLYEYVTAVMISIGVSMFIMTSPDSVKEHSTVTTTSGIIILVGYLTFDAFTANWQGELFKMYKMSSFQMMAGVNLFSVLFTSTTLLEQGGFFEAFIFMSRHPLFTFHVALLSVCSGVGQIIIFYTISEFGPVTFTIIMTLRQGIAILSSCLIYHHPVTLVGLFGVLFVFVAIFTRIYCGQQKKKAKQLQSVSTTSSKV